jgi:glycosyltransferase 2 family protein
MLGRARVVGFVVTLAIVAYGVWRLDLSKVGAALGTANYAVLPLSALATFCSYTLRAARWQRILAPTGWVPFRTLYPPLMIGFMANNVLPARMGEFVRAYSLNRATGISKTLALSTVMLERVFDGLALVAILALLAFFGDLPAIGGTIAYAAGLLFVVVAAGAWLVISNEALALRLLRVLTSPLPDTLSGLAEAKAQSFAGGLRSLREPRTLGVIGLLSALIWSVEALSYYLLMVGFHTAIGALALPAAFFLTVVINLGIMIPSAPGYVGTFEAAGIAALTPFGVAEESALALTIVSHAVQWLLVTLIGAALMARGGLSLRRLETAERT